MGNQDSKANDSDSDLEKTEKYTHHIKVLEQVSKPGMSGSESGEDDAYHSASDPERADVSRHYESESEHGSIIFSEDEESSGSEEEREEGRVASDDKEGEVEGRNMSVEKGTPVVSSENKDRFMKRQDKPILGIVDSSDSDAKDMESDEELLMEIDKCLENCSAPSGSGVPETSKTLMNRSPKSHVATSSPTSRMLDMVSVGASDTQNQFPAAGESVKRKISDVESEVITNADVRNTGGTNRPFRGEVVIPSEQVAQKELQMGESKHRGGVRSPKQFKHFTNSPFRTSPLLKPSARHVGNSEEDRKKTAEFVKAAIELTMPKRSLVSAVLDAKEEANSQKPGFLQDERKSGQHPVIYTQKQKKFPRHLLKANSSGKLPGNESPTLKHSTETSSPSEPNAMNSQNVQSSCSQELDEMETNTVLKSQAVDLNATPSPERETMNSKDAQFGSGPTFCSNINLGGAPANQTISVGPIATSSPTHERDPKHFSVFNSGQTFSALNNERVSPTTESLQKSFKPNQDQSNLNKISIGVTASTDVNENANPSNTSSQTHLKNPSSQTETQKMTPNITEMSTQTTASVSPCASTEPLSTMTSTEDLLSETATNYKTQTASVASQTTSSQTHSHEQESQTPFPASESEETHVPMRTSNSPTVNQGHESAATVVPMDVEMRSSAVVSGQTSGLGTLPTVTEMNPSLSKPVSSSSISAYPQQTKNIYPERIGAVLPPRGNVPSTRTSAPNASVNKTPNKRSTSPESTDMSKWLSSSANRAPTTAGPSISQSWFNPGRPAWSSFGDKHKLSSTETTTSSLSGQTANVETLRNPHYVGALSTPASTRSVPSESNSDHSSTTQNSNEVNVGIIGQKPSVSAGKPVSLSTPQPAVAASVNSRATSQKSPFPSTVSSEDYTRRTDMMMSSTSKPIPSSTSLSRSDDDHFANFKAAETASQMHPAGRTASAGRQHGERVNPSTPSTSVGGNIFRSQWQLPLAPSHQERQTPSAAVPEGRDRFERMPEPLIPPTSIKTEPSAPPTEVNPLANKGDKYSFELADDLKIHICFGDLVAQKVDALVNSTDGQLTHVNRTSMAVAAAAGSAMIQRCQTFLRENGGPLEKAQVFDTEASGALVGAVAHVLHVPTPGWIVESEIQSCNDLLKTYLSCLNFASDRLRLGSIAFPLIGTGE